ncbi:MAG: transcription termination/antitermination protein NusA [Alphaproteobacteria bacterium]|nr:transcription termination/antitermination protein NusA [Alphaproteobacteria bacterium]
MTDAAISANRLELLQIANAVAQEKQIDKLVVLEAMSDAIQKAASARYGADNNIQVTIDPTTGETVIRRLLEVSSEIENDSQQISLAEAHKRNPDANYGDILAEVLPPIEFGRIAAQSAKQVIMQRVRDAERAQMFDEYKDRVGDIVHGVVKRVEYGNIIVDLGRGEAIIRRDEALPRENLRNGDRVRAYVYDVNNEQKGPQIFLSRTRPEFMSKLFAQEVPEIFDGVIEIKSVARDPGSRAKIAVISSDSSIDPVGACVGMRGARVQAVVNELGGEKIDIVPWTEDLAAFIVNALAPAEVAKVLLDEELDRIEVVVPDHQLSLAIGRRGQNVRLATQLTGWNIEILTEEQESERHRAEFQLVTDRFTKALDVDETISQLLATEGFTTLEEVAYVAPEEVSAIEGFDEDTATEIQQRAVEYLEKRQADLEARCGELGIEPDLIGITSMTTEMLVRLGEEQIVSVDDFAGCASDDLVGWTERVKGETIKEKGYFDGLNVDRTTAEAMIIEARIHAGWIEAEPEVVEEDVEGEEAETEEIEAVVEEAEAETEAEEAVVEEGTVEEDNADAEAEATDVETTDKDEA